jgi:myosin-1
VKYHNNKPTVDFLAGKPMGLFSVLDEECLFPKGTDQSFLEKMNRNFSNSPLFRATGKDTFTVQHYAGVVPYHVANFLDKNRDTLFDDLKQLCQGSSMPLLQGIFDDQKPVAEIKGGKARPVTSGFQFRQSVAELLKALYACQPHYIRTIKPNDDKRPLYFDDARVTEQVRYLGLLENVRVRRAGYCYRTTFDRWMKRYAVISDKTFPNYNGNPRQGVELLLSVANIGSKEYAFGKTKLFIREPQTLYTMEETRLKALDKIANLIKNSKCPAKKVEGNVCLEYLRILIFQELGEFTLIRDPKKGGDKTYKSYSDVESEYVAGLIEPNELRSSLYQVLTDVSEPIREHFQKEKKSWWSFLKFFTGGKSQTTSLAAPS